MGASADDIALFSDEPKKPASGSGPASADDIALFADEPPKVEMGPEARRARQFGGMRMPAPDDVSTSDLKSDYTKRDIRRTLQGRQDLISTPDARERRDARARREDAIANDPLAGAIVQGIPAAGAGIVAGNLTRMAAPGLAPLVQGATTGAASSPDAPITGAVLGALPGVGSAARAADSAIGEAAFNRATTKGFGSGPGKVTKLLGKGVGAVAGGASHGPLGVLVGHDLGGRAANAMSKAGDAATRALARRWLDREIAAAPMGAPVADLAAARNIAALGSRAVPRATGFTANPPPIPERPTMAPPAAPEPIAAPPPAAALRKLKIIDENGRDLIANPPTPAESLRADVIRDAQRFRGQPYETGPSPKGAATPETAAMDRPELVFDQPSAPPTSIAAPDVGGQLDQSLQVLNLMKQAKKAGTLTPALIRSAVKLGMPAQTVLKIVGPEDFKAAMKPAAKLTPEDLGL